MGYLLIALAVVVAVAWFAWVMTRPRDLWSSSNVVTWLQAAVTAMIMLGGPLVALALLVLGLSRLTQ